MITSRRYDLDWLRIIAFTILVYFHAAITFFPGGLPLIQNDETSLLLTWFVSFSHQFRLALLFFISGVGIAFARRRRSNTEFVAERSKRLLIPLLFGVLFVVPPMVYTEKIFLGEFAGSFLAFYPEFFTEGVYPKGNLSWHHFWFIAYLYLYCLIGIQCFEYLSDDRSVTRFGEYGRDWRIYLFILPLFLVEVSLRAFFPGFRDLIHDWASFFHWFMILLAGFAIARDEKILANAERLRIISLAMAAVSSTLLFWGFYGANGFDLDPQEPNVIVIYISFCAVRMAMVWSCILTCLGFAGRYLQRPSSVLSYLNEAVYPLFILHLTTITVLSFYIVTWHVSLAAKYFLITTLTIIIILVVYHWLIRPFDKMRLLFGVKPKS